MWCANSAIYGLHDGSWFHRPHAKAWHVKLSRAESGTFKLCKQCLRRPHCAVPQHIGLLCSAICVRRAAPLASLRLPGCVLMCLPCLLSLPFCLLFSCFTVSPRKKYSFRSVILTAINISRNLLFAVPSLPLKRVWNKTGGGWISGTQGRCMRKKRTLPMLWNVNRGRVLFCFLFFLCLCVCFCHMMCWYCGCVTCLLYAFKTPTT